jgi:MscS family membrane protein
VSAQDQAPPPANGEEQATEDSPRSTVMRFLELAHSGQFVEASKYLELPADDSGRGAQLASRLVNVLDRQAWINPAELSAAASGDPDDGLSANVDEIAKVRGAKGLMEPVRLVRRGPQEARWQFSRVTVQRVDGWYAALPHRWLIELAPEPLVRMGPGNMLWAQWAALPLLLLASWSFGIGLSRLSRRILTPIIRRTQSRWDDAMIGRLARPVTFGWALVVAYMLVPLLGLYEPALNFAHRAIRALLFATFFWSLARAVDVAGQMFAQSQWSHGAPTTRSLVLFGSRVGKFFVAALALVALFSELGYPVASLIAGLGVGGIAVALAAQKSLENLIGAFTLAVDQPFREGDFVRVENFVGTVENIGMRSTRIRTLDRTVITIPNGKLSEMRLETFAARDRIRLSFTFGVTYGTSEPSLRQILDETERVLRDHPKIWPEGISVRLVQFGETALMIEVGCWFNTAEWDEFALIRQAILLEYVAIVERAGARFALPARIIEMTQPKAELKAKNVSAIREA